MATRIRVKMTDPLKSTAAPATKARSARELLLDWSNQQDLGVRAIATDVVSSRRELSPTAVAGAKDRYLAEKPVAGARPQ